MTPLVKAEGLARRDPAATERFESILERCPAKAAGSSQSALLRRIGAPRAINEPSSQQLQRVKRCLSSSIAAGSALARGASRLPVLPPLTPTQRDSGSKRRTPRPFWYAVRKWGSVTEWTRC